MNSPTSGRCEWPGLSCRLRSSRHASRRHIAGPERWASKMNRIKSTVLAVFVTTGVFAGEREVLRLDVYLNDAMTPMEIHSIITNISENPITIPTSTYSGAPTGRYNGDGNVGIYFGVGFSEVGDHPLVPSPQRFFPVTLKPGESTELPMAEATHEKGKTVEVGFEVDPEYAQRYGWWSGRVKKKVVVGEGPNPYVVEIPVDHKEPNKPPLRTPGSGTPAADAPVAPPPGAAGR